MIGGKNVLLHEAEFLVMVIVGASVGRRMGGGLNTHDLNRVVIGECFGVSGQSKDTTSVGYLFPFKYVNGGLAV